MAAADARAAACARVLARYYPEQPRRPEWFAEAGLVFAYLDDANSARLIAAAIVDDCCPTARDLDRLAERLGLYADNGRKRVAEARDYLHHPTTRHEGNDTWNSERMAPSSTTA